MRDTQSHAGGRPVLDGVRTRCGWDARSFDLALTLLILPFTLLLAALVAIAVVLDSPGPVLFRSTRVGRDGRHFRMLKFRTMRHQAGGAKVSSQGDRRYTPVGRLLAASRLDELPQLWNVLRGQMRLVGPRPEVEEFVLDQAESYRRILSVPPGITGPTQLRFADEGRLLASARDPEQFYRRELLPTKVRSDLDYVSRGSRIGDVAVLLRTWTVPISQLALAPAVPSGHSRTRVAPLLARAATLAAAIMTMVALFAVEGASAQGVSPPASDPGVTSPAGSVYELPLDAARRDAAPRARPGRRGRSGRSGSPRGPRGGNPGIASPIRSENDFGSSSKVPGVDGPAAGSTFRAGDRGAAARGAAARDGSGRDGRARFTSSRDSTAGPVMSPASQETGGSWPSPSLVLMLGLLLGVGIAAGVLAGRTRRS